MSSRKYRRAPQPTEAMLEAGRKAKEEERLAVQAVPGVNIRDVHECSGQFYKVTSDRIVHAGKGETVRLCSHKGATKALVESGHLVPVGSAATVTADNKKEADNG